MRSHMVSAAALAGFAALVSANPVGKRANAAYGTDRHWNGFSALKYLFVFGDSYTTTGFNLTNGSPLPSASNPLGNPPYPGYTAANGPNWVDWLTTYYNQSLLQTYNLAYGGATIDSALVKPYLPTVLSLKNQIEDLYLPILSTPPDRSAHSALPRWKSDDSLFLTWIGINDVGNTYYNQNYTFNDVLFDEYFSLEQKLYDTGARNFVFINVPPIDRSPLTTSQGSQAIALELADLKDYNTKLQARVQTFVNANRGTTAWFFDASSVFSNILNNPVTADWKFLNTTAYCTDYQNGTPAWDTFYPECGIPVDEYFWLNSLHPTYLVQQQVAKALVAQLTSS